MLVYLPDLRRVSFADNQIILMAGRAGNPKGVRWRFWG